MQVAIYLHGSKGVAGTSVLGETVQLLLGALLMHAIAQSGQQEGKLRCENGTLVPSLFSSLCACCDGHVIV